ncbi:hypothetical protein Leryth_021907, partial [Lithospermum erythrorhizon]
NQLNEFHTYSIHSNRFYYGQLTSGIITHYPSTAPPLLFYSMISFSPLPFCFLSLPFWEK